MPSRRLLFVPFPPPRFPPPRVRLAVTALSCIFFISACSLGRSSEPEPTVLPPSDEVPEWTEPEEEDSGADESSEMLTRAETHFEAGRYRQAGSLFTRFLENGASPNHHETDRALWGLAMVHLLPESPVQDQERAMAVLDRLADTHGETVGGAQARWVRSLLTELESIRSQVEAQERLLQQLTETVEQLKRIDLNRRPARPPDTIPSTPPRPRDEGS